MELLFQALEVIILESKYYFILCCMEKAQQKIYFYSIWEVRNKVISQNASFV